MTSLGVKEGRLDGSPLGDSDLVGTELGNLDPQRPQEKGHASFPVRVSLSSPDWSHSLGTVAASEQLFSVSPLPVVLQSGSSRHCVGAELGLLDKLGGSLANGVGGALLAEGPELGTPDMLGSTEGSPLGASDIVSDGDMEGKPDGSIDGKLLLDGASEAASLGFIDG